MKKIIIVALSLALLTLSACGGSDDAAALVPFASNEYQGEYLDAVVAELEGAGFTNISTEALFTLSDGENGTVGTVTIDGSHLFRKLDKHAPDVPVVVSYYELEENEPETPPEDTTEPEPPAPVTYTADAASIQQLASDKFGFEYDGLSVEWDDFDSAYAVYFHPTETPMDETHWVRQAINRYILFCQFAYEIEGVDRIRFNITADGQDQYGNAVTFEGLEVLMTKEYFSKFNWENLLYQEIWDVFNDSCYVFSLSPVFNEYLDTSKVFYDPHLRDGLIA